jgi:hypothetical protein
VRWKGCRKQPLKPSFSATLSQVRRFIWKSTSCSRTPNSEAGRGRTTEQALLVLANAIDQAWLRGRVATLVAFDLRGAFNGVNMAALDARLQERGSGFKVLWKIEQRAFDLTTFQTEVAAVPHAGLWLNSRQQALAELRGSRLWLNPRLWLG